MVAHSRECYRYRFCPSVAQPRRHPQNPPNPLVSAATLCMRPRLALRPAYLVSAVPRHAAQPHKATPASPPSPAAVPDMARLGCSCTPREQLGRLVCRPEPPCTLRCHPPGSPAPAPQTRCSRGRRSVRRTRQTTAGVRAREARALCAGDGHAGMATRHSQ